MKSNHDNPLRSRVTFVGVEDDVIEDVRASAGRRLELATMDNVEQLLTASGLGTLDCEVVILGEALSEPVRLAQRIHTLDKNIQVIILAGAGHGEEFRRAISLSPFLGDAVSLVGASERDGLPESIRRAVKRAHRRCSYRRNGESKRGGGAPTSPAPELAQYLGNLLEQAPIGLLTIDANSRIQTLNRRGREILGCSEREVLDTPFLSFFMPVDQIRLGRVLAGDQNFGGYFRVSAEEDEPRFVEVTASEYPSRSGQTGSMVIIHDVTERVNAENARRRTAAALQASEDRFMELAEVLRLIPWEADATTHAFTYVGEQAEEILGYPRAQWYRDDFWAEVLHPDDRERAQRLRSSNSRRLQNFDHRYRMVAADGRVVWIHDIVNVVRDEHANPRKLRGFMVDMSEKHEVRYERRHGRA